MLISDLEHCRGLDYGGSNGIEPFQDCIIIIVLS